MALPAGRSKSQSIDIYRAIRFWKEILNVATLLVTFDCKGFEISAQGKSVVRFLYIYPLPFHCLSVKLLHSVLPYFRYIYVHCVYSFISQNPREQPSLEFESRSFTVRNLPGCFFHPRRRMQRVLSSREFIYPRNSKWTILRRFHCPTS